MQVEVKTQDGGKETALTITDGKDTLTMIVRGNSGILKATNGRSWLHNSVASLNLLILRSRQAVTVEELIQDLGPCDEERLMSCRQSRNVG